MPTILRMKVAPRTAETGWRDMLLWRVPVDDVRTGPSTPCWPRQTGEAARRYREQQDWLSGATPRTP